jgi:hypothetical protein
MKLKSGREVYANQGIFGLEEKADGFSVTQGYDGNVRWPVPDWDDSDPERDLTADDMREIADMMIDRWGRFRAAL